MATKIRPVLSEKNKYYIDKHRYYELKHFCLQYDDCQTRLGDCVRLNYKAAGLTDVKAKVISQSITCESGCPVEETAKYTKNLWR